MNEFVSLDQSSMNSDNFKLDSIAQEHLKSSAIWSRFLGWVGIGYSFLLVIIAIFAVDLIIKAQNVPNKNNVAAVFTVTYLIMAIIMFFPPYFLLKHSNNALSALKTGNQENITACFKYLKTMNVFLGVLVIITLFFTLIGLLGALASA